MVANCKNNVIIPWPSGDSDDESLPFRKPSRRIDILPFCLLYQDDEKIDGRGPNQAV